MTLNQTDRQFAQEMITEMCQRWSNQSNLQNHSGGNAAGFRNPIFQSVYNIFCRYNQATFVEPGMT